MAKKTLRFKVSLVLFLCAALSIAFITFSAFYSLTDVIDSRSKRNASADLEIVHTVITAQIEDFQFLCKFFARHSIIQGSFWSNDSSEIYNPKPALEELDYDKSDVDLFALYDIDGNLVADLGFSDQRSNQLDGWAMNNRSLFVYSDIIDLPAPDLGSSIQNKLRSKNGVILLAKEPVFPKQLQSGWDTDQLGWLVIGKVLNVSKPNFLQQIERVFDPTKNLLIFSSKYAIAALKIAPSQFELEFNSYLKGAKNANNLIEYKRALHEQGYSLGNIQLDAHLNGDTTALFVGIYDPQASLSKTQQTMLFQLLIVAIFGIILTGGTSFYLTGYVFKPIRRLISIMRRVEAGDFSSLSDVKTRDAFGRLAQSFNSFTSRIRKSIEKENRYNQELASINSFGQTITSTLDLEKLLYMVVETTLKMMAVRRCSLWLVTPDGKALQNRITRGVAIFDSIEKPTVQIGEGIVGMVAETGKPLMINDLKSDERYSDLENPEYYGVRSILSVPIIALDKKIGVLNVSKEVVNGFDLNNENLLSTLAGQAGIAIHNANLYSEIAEKKRIEEELTIYRRIQLRLLPNRVPSVKGLMIHSSMIPAKEVGGDYYDFIFPSISDDSVGIVIGDVSGKGVSAGLIMMRTRTILHALAACGTSPKNALIKLNEYLAATVEVGKFMTLLYLLWEPNKKKMSYAAAGHEYILIYKAETGECQCIKSGGIAVGMVDDISLLTKEKELSVRAGDAVVLYTDGVTEAENSSGERYELDRLIAVVQKQGMKPAKELHKFVLDDIYKFIGGAEQWDDITLLIMKVGEIGAEQKETDEGEFFIDQELDMQFLTLEVSPDQKETKEVDFFMDQ